MGTPKEKQIFWLDGWDGKARGGLYFRSDLSKLIEKAEGAGAKAVGIVVDGTWNIELLMDTDGEPPVISMFKKDVGILDGEPE